MIALGQKHRVTAEGVEVATIEIVGITPTEFYFTLEVDEGFNLNLKEGGDEGPIFTCPIPKGTVDFNSPYIAEDETIKFKVTTRTE